MDRNDAIDALARGMSRSASRRRLIASGLGAIVAGAVAAASPSPVAVARRHCPAERACGKRCCRAGKTCGNPVQGICVGPDNPVSMQ